MAPRPASSAPASRAFRSFWLAGYDGADHFDRDGKPLSATDLTQHVRLARLDYAGLDAFGIRTVRESVGWRMVDRGGGVYDFSSLESRVRSARALDLQVTWTLCHYGWPDGLDPLSPAFVERFAQYARAVALYLAGQVVEPAVFSPIEEPSYLAWALSEGGRMKGAAHYATQGPALKRQFARATIAACDAIRDVMPGARFLHTDPLMHVVAPWGRPELVEAARRACERQYEGWDLLAGRLEPELGGGPQYLDLVGVNYYCRSQWELGTGQPLGWRVDDPRRKPLATLLEETHARYGRPIAIAETGHTGIERGAWVREVADEVRTARASGVPVEGVCLYPIIDCPDLQDPSLWHSSGLWELEPDGKGVLARRLNTQYARAFVDAQALV